MSDYLWDKTGEADAEAERLENLLGQLRFQPTPFDLPAELPAKDFRAARSRRSVLSWPRLAVAASITLAVLAGAWLVLRQQTGTITNAPQLAQQSNQPGTSDKQPAAPNSTDPAASNGAGDKRDGDEKPDAAAPERETNREERGGLRPRPRRPDLAVNPPRRLPRAVTPRTRNAEDARAPKRRDNFVTPHVELTRREEVARAEREAAEKVLYALRVTSEKLNYARQQVQESGRSEPNR